MGFSDKLQTTDSTTKTSKKKQKRATVSKKRFFFTRNGHRFASLRSSNNFKLNFSQEARRKNLLFLFLISKRRSYFRAITGVFKLEAVPDRSELRHWLPLLQAFCWVVEGGGGSGSTVLRIQIGTRMVRFRSFNPFIPIGNPSFRK